MHTMANESEDSRTQMVLSCVRAEALGRRLTPKLCAEHGLGIQVSSQMQEVIAPAVRRIRCIFGV